MKPQRLLPITVALIAQLAFPAGALATSPPTITSMFTPNTIPSAGASVLSFTITNNDSSQQLTGVGFTDSLPTGLKVASPNDVTGSCGTATLTATAGSSAISLSNGTVAQIASCTLSVNVTSSTPGVANNSTSVVTSDQDGSSATGATASLTVVAPPSISSSFTPNSIGVGGTSALSFTIKNPGTAKTLDGIAFTDTLPPGLQVDNPNGENGTCGSAAVVAAAPGSSTIALTGGKLATGASCTMSVAVTSNIAGVYSNNTGQVTSNEGGAGKSNTQSLTVIGAPTVTIIAPTKGATFGRGEKVVAKYSCREAPGGPGIGDCSGDSSNGSRLDTSSPGKHTFTVTAISGDGAVSNETISYRVVKTVTHVTDHSNGAVSFDLAGSSRITVSEHGFIAGARHRHLVSLASLSATAAAGTDAFTVNATQSGQAYLRHARSKHETVVVSLRIASAGSRAIAIEVLTR